MSVQELSTYVSLAGMKLSGNILSKNELVSSTLEPEPELEIDLELELELTFNVLIGIEVV